MTIGWIQSSAYGCAQRVGKFFYDVGLLRRDSEACLKMTQIAGACIGLLGNEAGRLGRLFESSADLPYVWSIFSWPKSFTQGVEGRKFTRFIEVVWKIDTILLIVYLGNGWSLIDTTRWISYKTLGSWTVGLAGVAFASEAVDNITRRLSVSRHAQACKTASSVGEVALSVFGYWKIIGAVSPQTAPLFFAMTIFVKGISLYAIHLNKNNN